MLGESILPYRLLQTFEGAIPFDEEHGLITEAKARALIDDPDVTAGFGAVANWLATAEKTWEQHRSAATTLSLAEQLDYYGKLSAQFPIAPIRLVYAKAGTLPAACIVRDPQAVIDHMLYWHAPASEEEAAYLAAILNSEAARARAEHFQARGQFGARHFDKVIFNLPIPRFDAAEPVHAALATAGAEAEAAAADVELVAGEGFVKARQRVRRALAEQGIAAEIDKLVEKLLDG
jgi:hypothetical protein